MGRHDHEAGSSSRRRRQSRSPPPARVVPRRGTNFNLAEATILAEHGILVPVSWHLPAGWKVANDGHAIPPLPVEDADVEAVAAYRRSLMAPHQRNDPRFHSRGYWRERLPVEREEAVNRAAVPYGGPYNAAGRHEVWDGLDVDDMLASYGYMPDSGRRRAPRRVAYFGAPPRAVDAPPLSRPATVKEEDPVQPPEINEDEDVRLAEVRSVAGDNALWGGLQQAIA